MSYIIRWYLTHPLLPTASPCGPPATPSRPPAANAPVQDAVEEDEDEMKQLTADQLHILRTSPQLRPYISDSRLQQVISAIDSHPQRADALESRMNTDHDFAAFVNMLLDELGEGHDTNSGPI
eukprot:TRINITY_DN9225_c0_g1_i1.p1 TRINITY_DN9225_c0_g1~~TRINITY_DN9225_c0_g1_i1.p1  ORF type:complete len:123 (-),score=17.79 TRINITY_DN9225_c0_g1_i1:377-745(-)